MKKYLLLLTAMGTFYGPVVGRATPIDQRAGSAIRLTAAASDTPHITLDATLGELVTQDFLKQNYSSIENADSIKQDLLAEKVRAKDTEARLSTRMDEFSAKNYLSEDGTVNILLPDKRQYESVSFEALAMHYYGALAIAIYGEPITETMSGKFLAIGGSSSESDALQKPYVFTDQQGDYVLGCFGGTEARVAITAPVLTAARGAEVKNGIARKQTTFMLRPGDTLRLVAQWVTEGDVVYYARLSRASSEEMP